MGGCLTGFEDFAFDAFSTDGILAFDDASFSTDGILAFDNASFSTDGILAFDDASFSVDGVLAFDDVVDAFPTDGFFATPFFDVRGAGAIFLCH